MTLSSNNLLMYNVPDISITLGRLEELSDKERIPKALLIASLRRPTAHIPTAALMVPLIHPPVTLITAENDPKSNQQNHSSLLSHQPHHTTLRSQLLRQLLLLTLLGRSHPSPLLQDPLDLRLGEESHRLYQKREVLWNDPEEDHRAGWLHEARFPRVWNFKICFEKE